MRRANEPLDLDPGRQTLVSVGSMASAIESLPGSAFENLLVVSPNAPARVEKTIERQGGDASRCGHIPLTSSGLSYEGPLWTTSPVAPSDLTGLNMRYSRAMEHVESGRGCFCFDGVQLLLMYAAADDVQRLLTTMASATRTREVAGVYGLAREAVTPETYERLASIFDDSADRRPR
ncbi:DUF7504 family protein [Haloparvum sedimenti]|uniref:DUF7504 family protein n=1 Tax=Haloparvum sedimenti TaxID=1678448 RepID=UPI000F7AE799|nr:hypothetical protein [Haloparvum sedimenti]